MSTTGRGGARSGEHTQVRTQSPQAADLLCLLAFLAPDDIPVPLLMEAGPKLTGTISRVTRDAMSLHQAVQELNRYSFLRGYTGDFIGVHELVQTVLKAYLEPDERSLWGGRAVELLLKGFPEHSSDPETWERCTRLLPHIAATTDSAEAIAADPLATASLLNREGGYIRHRSGFTTAEELLRRASNLMETTYGPVFSAYVDTLERMGRVLCNTGRLQEARHCYERALWVSQALWGETDRRVARLRERIGFEVLRPQGDLSGAKRMLERVTRASRAGAALESAFALCKLGFVQWDLQELDRARKSFEQALRLFRSQLEPDHPEIARALSGLGQVHLDEGHLDEARACQEKALGIFRTRLGAADIEVAKTLDKLGYVLREQGDAPGSRTCHEEALSIYGSIFKDDTHRKIGFAMTNLGMACRELGDAEAARRHQEAALAIFRELRDERYVEIVSGRLAAVDLTC